MSLESLLGAKGKDKDASPAVVLQQPSPAPTTATSPAPPVLHSIANIALDRTPPSTSTTSSSSAGPAPSASAGPSSTTPISNAPKVSKLNPKAAAFTMAVKNTASTASAQSASAQPASAQSASSASSSSSGTKLSVPNGWNGAPSRYTKGGFKWIHPDETGHTVRYSPGNPNSPHASAQVPYMRQTLFGRYVDADGYHVERNDAAGHIPASSFVYRTPDELLALNPHLQPPPAQFHG